ncbi:MAG: NAD(+)/NADH kinase, partial [Oscillospiraceae bacterium]
MKIALLPNFTREKSYEITTNICKQLDELDAEYCLLKYEKKYFKNEKAKYMAIDELLIWCDVVIAVGGDGSFLNAAKKAVKYNKPILCVNAGRLAFMAGLEGNELKLLKKLTDGDYKMDKRLMLDVKLLRDGKVIAEDFCINDVVLARGAKLKMTDIIVECDDKLINTYRGDGIIVATPTGSTAYSLSSGGPVVNPTTESIILTPICTQSLFARSIIFSHKNNLSIYPDESSMNSDLYLSFDGEETINVRMGDKITIKKDDRLAE